MSLPQECRAESASYGRQTGRILVVDESLVARRVLERLLREGGFDLCGVLPRFDQIEPMLDEQDVDLILLGQDGPLGDLSAMLDRIGRRHRAPRIVLFTGADVTSTRFVQPLGCKHRVEVICKPSTGHFTPEFAVLLVEQLSRLVAEVKTSDASPNLGANDSSRPLGKQIGAIAIGGSTGGVGAISTIVKALPYQNRVPVFVTQHLPSNFQPLFVQQLARLGPNPVVQAQDNMVVRPGVVHLASGQGHMSFRREPGGLVRIRFTTEQFAHDSFPAVDPMFAGAAAVYGDALCGIILSGMGRDGLAGARAVIAAGGWLIAQDEASSAVWGMPGAVARAGFASALVPPDGMVPLLLQQGLGR